VNIISSHISFSDDFTKNSESFIIPLYFKKFFCHFFEYGIFILIWALKLFKSKKNLPNVLYKSVDDFDAISIHFDDSDDDNDDTKSIYNKN